MFDTQHIVTILQKYHPVSFRTTQDLFTWIICSPCFLFTSLVGVRREGSFLYLYKYIYVVMIVINQGITMISVFILYLFFRVKRLGYNVQ